jgi:hypothetical protein
MQIEDLGRSLATIAVWVAPAFAVWATGSPAVAWVFLLSFIATSMVWRD